MCPEKPPFSRLLSGDLSKADRRRWQAHLEVCGTCRREFEMVRSGFDAVAAWQVHAPMPDLFEGRVLRVAGVERGEMRRRGRESYLLRVAASVVLATGAGALTARVGTTQGPAPAVLSDTDASADDVVRHLGLDALAGNDAVLAPLFERDAAASPEEGRS